MIKKILLISGSIMLLCIIGAAVLVPIAVADSVDAAAQLDLIYNEMKEAASFSGEGVTQVQFTGSSWTERLEVVTSPDEDIHVYTNGYRMTDTRYDFRLSEEGELEIYVERSAPGIASLTKDNLLKAFAAQMNNRWENQVRLALPAEVAFNLDVNVWALRIDDGVKTIEPPQEHPDLEWETPPEIAQEAEGELTPERLLGLSTQLRECNDNLVEYYRQIRANTLTDEDFWQQAPIYLEESRDILGWVYQGEMDRDVFKAELMEYGEKMAQYNIIVLQREYALEQYEQEQITKESFYEIDLKLDDLAETVEEQLEPLRYLEEIIPSLERQLNLDALIDNTIDGKFLEVYKEI